MLVFSSELGISFRLHPREIPRKTQMRRVLPFLKILFQHIIKTGQAKSTVPQYPSQFGFEPGYSSQSKPSLETGWTSPSAYQIWCWVRFTVSAITWCLRSTQVLLGGAGHHAREAAVVAPRMRAQESGPRVSYLTLRPVAMHISSVLLFSAWMLVTSLTRHAVK
jgi:hypothetical protein